MIIISQLFQKARNLGSDRHRQLEQSFVNSIVDYWRKYVISELKDIRNPADLNRSVRIIIANMFAELRRRTEVHIKNILRLGLIDGLESATRIPDSVIERTFEEYLQQSKIYDAIRLTTERLSTRLLTLSSLDQIALTALPAKAVETALKNIAYSELGKFKTAIRSDTQYAVNLGRTLAWRKRDPTNIYRYEWGIGTDSRVTDCCKEIKATVEKEAKDRGELGVTLDRLIEICRIVGNKYFPRFRQRDLNPHWNCRSHPRRRVI